MSAVSPLAIFGFLARRTVANAIVRRMRRLKEPRYLIGLAFGIFYFVSMILRPGRRGRVGHGMSSLPPELPGILLLAAAFAIAVLVLAGWLLRKGDQALTLSEAEVQYLFPAPLSARAVLHYALLRTQLALLFSSAVVTLILRGNFTAGGLRLTLGVWILLSVLQFHFKALGFTKARWRERPARQRLTLFTAAFVVVIGLLAILGTGIYQALDVVTKALNEGSLTTLAGIEPAMASARAGAVCLVLLWPIRVVLLPLIAGDTRHFLAALVPALGVLLLHYAWLARTAVRYEEATLEHAGRRAENRLRRRENTGRTIRPGAGREKVPFALGSIGRPEMSIVWKNLLAFGRFRGRRVAIGLAVTILLSLSGAFLSVRLKPELAQIALSLAGLVATGALMVGPMITFVQRNDLRGDLEQASLLRQWPISPVRLVTAELAAPWLLSTAIVWGGLAVALALTAGSSLALAQRRMSQEALDAVGLESWARFGTLFPISLGLALAIPAVVAVVLVVQNGTVLTFPAWFPPGRKRSAGLEATGMRLLSMMAILLLLLVALIPAAILVVPLLIFGWSALGFWTIPIAGLLTAAPLAAEAAGGVFVLARLFERFDPSLELNA
jgi:ABC-2 type transport system permease protein